MKKGKVSKIIVEIEPPISTTFGSRDDIANQIRQIINKRRKTKHKVSITFEE